MLLVQDYMSANKKPAMFMLMLTFLVAPFYYHENIGGTGLNLPGNIVIWLCAIIFIFFTANSVLSRSILVIPKHAALILAFPILATLSGFLSGVTEPLEWGFRLLFVWGGALFLLALFQLQFSRSDWDKLLLILVLSGLVHAILACIQVFQPEDVTIYLPKAPSNIATGVFQQINIQATFQATVVVLCWYLSLRPLAKQNHLVRVVIYLSLWFATYIVMISGSRVGMLSMLVSTSLLVLFYFNQIKHHKKTVVLLIFIMVSALFLSVYSDGLSRLFNKVENIQTEYSTSQRIGIYRVAAEVVKDKPVLGHGIGSFESVWQYEKAHFQEKNPSYQLIDSYVTHPHNELLFWQVEGGLLASLGIVVSFVSIFLIAWKSNAKHTLAFLFPFAFHNQVELPFHLSANAWFLTLLLICVALAHSKKHVASLSPSVSMRKSVFLMSHISLVLAVVFFAHSLIANAELNRAIKPDNNETLKVSSINPYFTKIAEDFHMQRLFNVSASNRSVEGMRAFLTWQREEIKSRPTAFNYKMLIASYQNLQNINEACAAARVASQMYQGNHEFRAYSTACSEN